MPACCKPAAAAATAGAVGRRGHWRKSKAKRATSSRNATEMAQKRHWQRPGPAGIRHTRQSAWAEP
eukprot:10245925-Lingulodinium_polyedra.AAC.1